MTAAGRQIQPDGRARHGGTWGVFRSNANKSAAATLIIRRHTRPVILANRAPRMPVGSSQDPLATKVWFRSKEAWSLLRYFPAARDGTISFSPLSRRSVTHVVVC